MVEVMSWDLIMFLVSWLYNISTMFGVVSFFDIKAETEKLDYEFLNKSAT